MIYRIGLLVAIVGQNLLSTVAQIPCDEAYGTHCPESSGWDVSACLKNVDASTLSPECLNYIALHDNCKSDIDTHCTGKEYTGDLLVCLTEWTKPDALTADCAGALPKKEKKEKKLSEKEKKKAEARRKTRKAAEKMARSMNSKSKEDAKKGKKAPVDDDEDDDEL